jgi:hypothetical protein
MKGKEKYGKNMGTDGTFTNFLKPWASLLSAKA